MNMVVVMVEFCTGKNGNAVVPMVGAYLVRSLLASKDRRISLVVMLLCKQSPSRSSTTPGNRWQRGEEHGPPRDDKEGQRAVNSVL